MTSQAFNSHANNGGFSSQAEFELERQTLIARSDQLDGLRVSINNDINLFNSLLRS